MANSQGLIMIAGGLAFVGSFKEAGGFPSNGYAVVGGTVALSFIASLTNNTALEPAVKALGVLMILGAAYRYIPGLSKTNAKNPKIQKGKTNG
jgi:hypothetical protein